MVIRASEIDALAGDDRLFTRPRRLRRFEIGTRLPGGGERCVAGRRPWPQ